LRECTLIDESAMFYRSSSSVYQISGGVLPNIRPGTALFTVMFNMRIMTKVFSVDAMKTHLSYVTPATSI